MTTTTTAPSSVAMIHVTVMVEFMTPVRLRWQKQQADMHHQSSNGSRLSRVSYKKTGMLRKVLKVNLARPFQRYHSLCLSCRSLSSGCFSSSFWERSNPKPTLESLLRDPLSSRASVPPQHGVDQDLERWGVCHDLSQHQPSDQHLLCLLLEWK